MLLNYCKGVGWKRFLFMLIGNVLVGMGVAIFKMSAMGNDPFNGMNMAVSSVIGISYPAYQVIVNIGLLIVELIAGRQLIGFGTVVNAVFLGYIASFFYHVFSEVFFLPETILMRVVTVLIGVLVCSLGLSLYQQSDAGVAPYDALAMIMDRRMSKLSYFWCRIITDGACALVCFLFGGIIGLGTVVTVFGMGPFIHFFDRHISKKILKNK